MALWFHPRMPRYAMKDGAGKVVATMVVTVTTIDRHGLTPATSSPVGFAATWTTDGARYARAKADGGGYAFGSWDDALNAGAESARQAAGAVAMDRIDAGGPSLDEAVHALRATLQFQLLDPFAEAVHAKDQPKIDAYRALIKQAWARIYDLDPELRP